MYDINVKFVKKGKWFYATFFGAGLLFFVVMLGIYLSTIFKINSMDSKTLSTRVVINANYNNEGNTMYRPTYYFNVEGKEYACYTNVSTGSNPGTKNKMVYYDSNNPEKCITDFNKSTNNILLIFLLLPLIFIIIGGKGISKVNKRVKIINELNNNGKLVKNLRYTLVNSNMSVNGVRIKIPLVKYTLPTGVEVDLYGDARHDKKHFDKDGLVDLVIDENNPTNYFIDFEINRIGGNLPDDYYVEPKVEENYITNEESKEKKLDYTVVSEEEFNRLRQE